jgi:hypothetical protein
MRGSRRIVAIVAAASLALTGGVLVSASADASKAPQVLKFKVRTLTEHEYGQTGFLAAEVAKAGKKGKKIIGYDGVHAAFDPATETVNIHVALALKGGTILVDFVDVPVKDARFSGELVAGSGKFAGITGTAQARSIGDGDVTRVTLRYTLP